MQFNRKIARRAAALALAGGAGAVALGAAAPAFAATGSGPSSSASATVHVVQSITISLTTAPSFSLAPNQISRGALGFNVATNDGHGYTVTIQADHDPQTAQGQSAFQSSALTYNTLIGGAQAAGTQNQQQLTNTPSTVLATTTASGGSGDTYSQDWTANLPANVAPGDYSSNLTLVASAN